MPTASLHNLAAPGIAGAHVGANLSYTRFLFLQPRRASLDSGRRLRDLASATERGFYNAFELHGAHDAGPHETVQFLSPEARDDEVPHVIQVSSKYRPRLDEVEKDVRRRSTDFADVVSLTGAVRALQYTSAETYTWAYAKAHERASGRYLPNAIILPLRKSAAWWAMPSMERHQFFYPHHDRTTGQCVPGHALIGRNAAEHICRRVFHNPDGSGRSDEWDFITYFECADEYLELFETTLDAMRDVSKNPEWRYVEEGPIWRGKRVNRW